MPRLEECRSTGRAGSGRAAGTEHPQGAVAPGAGQGLRPGHAHSQEDRPPQGLRAQARLGQPLWSVPSPAAEVGCIPCPSWWWGGQQRAGGRAGTGTVTQQARDQIAPDSTPVAGKKSQKGLDGGFYQAPLPQKSSWPPPVPQVTSACLAVSTLTVGAQPRAGGQSSAWGHTRSSLPARRAPAPLPRAPWPPAPPSPRPLPEFIAGAGSQLVPAPASW